MKLGGVGGALELSPSVIGPALTKALAYRGISTNRRPSPLSFCTPSSVSTASCSPQASYLHSKMAANATYSMWVEGEEVAGNAERSVSASPSSKVHSII